MSAHLLKLAIAALAATSAGLAGTYSAVADFNAATNPVGPWAYGSATSVSNLNAGFTLYTGTGDCGFGSPFACWSGGNNSIPLVGSTPTDFGFSTAQVLADALLLHPGASGEYSIVRFIAPETDTYALSGLFRIQDIQPSGVTLDVILGSGDSIFSGSLGGGTAPFSASLALTAGDAVYFAVGSGPGGFVGDSTGLQATFVNGEEGGVPEPSSLGLAALGMAISLGLRYRIRSRRPAPSSGE